MNETCLALFQFPFFNCDTCDLRLYFSKGYNALYDLLLLIWNWFKILDSSVHSKKVDAYILMVIRLWQLYQNVGTVFSLHLESSFKYIE